MITDKDISRWQRDAFRDGRDDDVDLATRAMKGDTAARSEVIAKIAEALIAKVGGEVASLSTVKTYLMLHGIDAARADKLVTAHVAEIDEACSRASFTYFVADHILSKEGALP